MLPEYQRALSSLAKRIGVAGADRGLGGAGLSSSTSNSGLDLQALLAAASSAPPRPPAGARCVLGLDVGSVCVGVAVSDASNSRALPLATLLRRRHLPDARATAELLRRVPQARAHTRGQSNRDVPRVFSHEVVPMREITAPLQRFMREYSVVAVCVGCPMAGDDTAKMMTGRVLTFVDQLRRAGLATDYYLWDESNSSRAVNGFLERGGFALTQSGRWQKRQYDGASRARSHASQSQSQGQGQWGPGLDSLQAAVILQDFLRYLRS